MCWVSTFNRLQLVFQNYNLFLPLFWHCFHFIGQIKIEMQISWEEEKSSCDKNLSSHPESASFFVRKSLTKVPNIDFLIPFMF